MTARELLSAMAFALATGETPEKADWYPDPRSFEQALDDYRAELAEEFATALLADTAHIRYGSATDYAERHAALIRRMAAPTTTKEQP